MLTRFSPTEPQAACKISPVAMALSMKSAATRPAFRGVARPQVTVRRASVCKAVMDVNVRLGFDQGRAAADSPWWVGTDACMPRFAQDDTFKAEVLSSAQPVLVDFWAPW